MRKRVTSEQKAVPISDLRAKVLAMRGWPAMWTADALDCLDHQEDPLAEQAAMLCVLAWSWVRNERAAQAFDISHAELAERLMQSRYVSIRYVGARILVRFCPRLPNGPELLLDIFNRSKAHQRVAMVFCLNDKQADARVFSARLIERALQDRSAKVRCCAVHAAAEARLQHLVLSVLDAIARELDPPRKEEMLQSLDILRHGYSLEPPCNGRRSLHLIDRSARDSNSWRSMTFDAEDLPDDSIASIRAFLMKGFLYSERQLPPELRAAKPTRRKSRPRQKSE